MLNELREHLLEFERMLSEGTWSDEDQAKVDAQALADQGEALANAVRELLNEPDERAGARAGAPHARPAERSVTMHRPRRPFDLPEGYWQANFEDPMFVCGIAPDGSVSS
jgi:hypothetical protein